MDDKNTNFLLGQLLSKTDSIHDIVAELKTNHSDLAKRVTSLEHLKIAIIAGATATGSVIGLSWEKLKAIAGHLIS